MHSLLKFLCAVLLVLASTAAENSTSPSVDTTTESDYDLESTTTWSPSPTSATTTTTTTTRPTTTPPSVSKDEYIGPILVCKNRTDDGLNECLERVLGELRPRLAGGIPEIGVPPLDPLHLDRLDFKQGSGNIIVKAHFTNLTMRHLAKFNKAVFKINTKQRALTFDLEAPRVYISGTYNVGGRILFFPIGGTGPFYFDAGGAHAFGKAFLKIVTRQDGNRTVELDKVDLDLSIRSIKVRLDNLFNGNKLLGPVMNTVLNENGLELFQEVKPNLILVVLDLVKDLANAILGSMPFLVEYLEGA